MFSDIPNDTEDFKEDSNDLKNLYEDAVQIPIEYIPKIKNQINNEKLKSQIRDLVIKNLIKKNLIKESDAENVMVEHSFLYSDDLDACHGILSTTLNNKILMYYVISYGKMYAATQKRFIDEANAIIDTYGDQLGIELPNMNNKTR